MFRNEIARPHKATLRVIRLRVANSIFFGHHLNVASTLQFLKHPLDLIGTLWNQPAAIQTPIAVTAATKSAGTVPVPTVETATTLNGLCGWISPEPGAAGNFSCQFVGTVMPGVVFIVSITVVVLTAFFLVRYFSRSWTLAGELEDLTASLSKIKGDGSEWANTNACDQVLKAIDRSGERAPPISILAEKIRAAKLDLPGSPKARIALRESIREITRDVRSTERWSGRALAEALPGWLTAIGLLTTFLAILLGLQSVRVLANLEVQGIGGLVNGLSGKFFSSIAALGCAVTITVLHYFVSNQVKDAWNKMSERLQELLPHLSVERAFLALLAREPREDR